MNVIKEIQAFVIVAQIKGHSHSAVVHMVQEMRSHYNLNVTALDLVDSIW